MTEREIEQLVFVREEPVAADLAIVFGAACEQEMRCRTLRGVALRQQGHTTRLLVTGGGVLAQMRPEAQRMAEVARELGVPKSDVLVEDQSANTFQNVRFSLELLESRGLLHELRTALLVSSEWHMRRVLLTTRKYFPAGLKLVCCPTLEGCNRDNWMRSSECRATVEQEALLLATFRQTGAL
jgi:hypothetical protein